MKATGLPAEDIARLYSAENLDYDGDNSWIHLAYGKRVLGLKQRGANCRFLNEHGLCTVYDARPMTCRTYPYMVYCDDAGRVEKLELNPDVDCCGRTGPTWPKRQLLRDARQEDAEDARYWKQLRRWERNGRRGGKRGLLRFLGLTS
jgi:Fe-S-cluster containining protein